MSGDFVGDFFFSFLASHTYALVARILSKMEKGNEWWSDKNVFSIINLDYCQTWL